MIACSLCLPPELPPINGMGSRDFLRTQFVQAIQKMVTGKDQVDVETNGENDDEVGTERGIQDRKATERGNSDRVDNYYDSDGNILALMLSKSLRPKDIEEKGITALSTMDADQFELMNAANTALPKNQRLKCYIVCLQYSLSEDYGGWERVDARQSTSCYSINGKRISTDTPIKWTETFDFINPGNENLSELWANEGSSTYDDFKRFSIVWWPNDADTSTLLELLGEDEAITSILAENPVDATKLQDLMLGHSSQTHRSANSMKPEVGLPFCRGLCTAICELGDIALVEPFFKKYFARLKMKRELAQTIAELVVKMGWDNVSAAILGCIKLAPFQDGMGIVLELAEALPNLPAARATAITFVIDQASASSSRLKQFASSDDVGLLWKLVLASENRQLFFGVGTLFKRLKGDSLGHIVSALSSCVEASSLPEHFATLVVLATRRYEWLTNEVTDIEKPFSWELVDSNFPGAVELSAFLEGSDRIHRINGFKGIVEARARVEVLLKKVKAPLEITAGGRGRDAHVGVTKSGGQYDCRRNDLSAYLAEIEMLGHLIVSIKEKARTV